MGYGSNSRGNVLLLNFFFILYFRFLVIKSFLSVFICSQIGQQIGNPEKSQKNEFYSGTSRPEGVTFSEYLM